MKLQCIINNLRNGIVIAERSAAKNQTLPILNSVFIDAEKDVIKLKSTNLETALEIIIPGKIIESAAYDILYGEEPKGYEKIKQEIESISIKDVEKAVDKYLKPEDIRQVLLVPKELIIN